MARLALPVLAAITASAAAAEQITWGSVVFTYHGEKPPSLSNDGYQLTSLGANQLFQAGQAMRDRYIDNPEFYSGVVTPAPINGISSNTINNLDLEILSTKDEFISSSAQAFMQGLYPPVSNRTVPLAKDILANKTAIENPLNGYQYPQIETVSSLNVDYIWIAGDSICASNLLAGSDYYHSQETIRREIATREFYDSLSGSIFAALQPPSIINYYQAYLLYEYALYQYNHNSSSDIVPAELSTLYSLASEQQLKMNTPTNSSNLPTIAGRTLAAKVLQSLYRIIASDGSAEKLTFLFGSFEPMLSFFNLSRLSTGASGPRFRSLPLHGSVMAFELFSERTDSSTNQNQSAPFPSTSQLKVRFMFRNGTDDSENLVAYSLFGNGPAIYEIPWADFVRGMGEFSLNNVSDWCDACAVNGDDTTIFCAAIDADPTDSGNSTTSPVTKHSQGLSPAIAGVIGAIVTLGLALLAIIGLCLFGFRLKKHDRSSPKANASSEVYGGAVLGKSGSGNGNGGFKGAEKLASDTDLRLKNGSGSGATVVRHERVGSWELNDSPGSDGQRNLASSLDKDLENGRVVSRADYSRRSEDGLEHVNPFGDPVKPADHF